MILGAILKAAVILLAGAGAGLVYNAFSTTGIPLRTPAQPSFEEQISWNLHVESRRVTLADAKQAFDRKKATFIDARSPHDYAAGHIPGALNLSVFDFEARNRKLLKTLPGALDPEQRPGHPLPSALFWRGPRRQPLSRCGPVLRLLWPGRSRRLPAWSFDPGHPPDLRGRPPPRSHEKPGCARPKPISPLQRTLQM